jgi:hypothetical protein
MRVISDYAPDRRACTHIIKTRTAALSSSSGPIAFGPRARAQTSSVQSVDLCFFFSPQRVVVIRPIEFDRSAAKLMTTIRRPE